MPARQAYSHSASVGKDGWTRNRDAVIALGQLILGLLLLDVLFQLSEFLIAFRGGIPGHIEGLKLVISGLCWWVFWGWQVVLGTVLPIVLLVAPTRRSPYWVSLAGFLIAAGLLGLRLNIVIPGLAVEEIEGLSQAFVSLRTNPHYFPSPSEWLLTAGIVGLGLLLFGVGEMLLPRSEEDAAHVRARRKSRSPQVRATGRCRRSRRGRSDVERVRKLGCASASDRGQRGW